MISYHLNLKIKLNQFKKLMYENEKKNLMKEIELKNKLGSKKKLI